MKHKGSRDLMVVLREAHLAPDLLEAETTWLNNVLNHVEDTPNLARCCEIINLSRYRIEKRYQKVLSYVHAGKKQPFVFLFNKN